MSGPETVVDSPRPGEDSAGPDWSRAAALWDLDPAVAHCNHGSFGAVPEPVLRVQRQWQDRMNANPVRFFRQELRPLLETTREQLAARVGSDADGLALVPNVTTGVSTVLAAFPLEPGEEVLLTDHAYGAVVIAVERACARAGARVVTVTVPWQASGEEVLARVLESVGPRTRLAVLDHITSPTARRFPVEALLPALAERGVAVLVDAAHGPGMVDVDLAALAPDFWVGNFHKWVCAPRGSAGLYVAPRWRAGVHPLVASWDEPAGFPRAFNQTGTADPTPALATPAAFDLLEALGWERLRARNVELAAYGQARLAEVLGLDLVGLPGDEGVSMRAVPLPAGVAETHERALDFGVRVATELGVEVAVVAWRGQGLLRVSGHAYNARADYERLTALPDLLAG